MSRRLDRLSFHALFDAAADALLLVDDVGHIVMGNPSALDLLGYKQDALSGMEVEALLPIRYREGHRHYRNAFSARPAKRSMAKGSDLVVLCSDGREVAVDIGLSPLDVEDQHYILITFIDATRRHQAQAALQASEERLRLAKRAAGLGIFDHDLINNTIEWDERTRELCGVGPEDVVTNEKFLAGIHPDDRAIRQAALNHALNPAGNGEYYVECRVLNGIKKVDRWIVATGQVFFENGRAVRLVGTVQDITERKAMERMFRDHRIEMDALLKRQVAAQTASAIAHELNQPLAALSAYSEVALHELGNSAHSEKLERALAGCVKQAQRAGQSLHELLEFLQKGEPLVEPLDLNHLLQDTLAILQTDGLGEFRPVLEFEQNLPRVLGNALQVQKVLINLLRNGVEAMRDAGIPKPTIKLKTSTRRNQAMVTIQDSGPGFDAETAQRIFEPFFTTKSRGIGIGLAISRALIEAGGGLLWADPDAGPGATFHFTLPFVPR